MAEIADIRQRQYVGPQLGQVLGVGERDGIVGKRLDLGDRVFNFMENPNAGKSVLEKTAKYVDGPGMFRGLQLLDKGPGLINQLAKDGGSELNPLLAGIQPIAAKGWQIQSIIRIPSAMNEAWEAIQRTYETTTLPGEAMRNVTKAVQMTFGAVANFFYAATMLFSVSGKASLASSSILTADTFDAGENVLVGGMALQDSYLARQEATKLGADTTVAPEFVQSLLETARFNMLKMLKATCTVSNYVLSMMPRLIGRAVVSPAVTMTISLAGTVLAISAHFYEQSMKYTSMNFFKSSSFHLIAPVTV